MTKLRAPLSFGQAIDRIAGQIGYAEMCAVTGRAERTIRAWSDPDLPALPTLEDAFQLDRAFLAAGGEEPPLTAVLALRLDCALPATAEHHDLAEAAGAIAREAGEAVAALIAAGQGDPTAVAEAVRQTQEAVTALQVALRRLGPAATGPP